MMRGFTLIELVIVMGIATILLAVLGLNLRPLNNPLNDSAQQVAAMIKQSRLKAMSNTMAVRVQPASATQLQAESANNCGATSWTNEPQFGRKLGKGITFKTTTWSICFDGRGLTSSSTNIYLQRQSDGTQRHIEVLLGGAVVGP